jgi:hypothetical protein
MKPALELIGVLEMEIARDEAAIVKKRAAVDALRAAYDDVGAVSRPVRTTRTARATVAPSPAAGGKVAARHAEIDARVLKICNTKPVAQIEITRALGSNRDQVKDSVRRLVSAKQLACRGRMRSARYGTEAAFSADAPEGD